MCPTCTVACSKLSPQTARKTPLMHGSASHEPCALPQREPGTPGQLRVQETGLRKSRSGPGRGPLGSLQVLIRTAAPLEASCSSATRLRAWPKSGRHSRSIATSGSRIEPLRRASAVGSCRRSSTTCTLGPPGGPPPPPLLPRLPQLLLQPSSTSRLLGGAASCSACASPPPTSDRSEAQLHGTSSTGMLHHCGAGAPGSLHAQPGHQGSANVSYCQQVLCTWRIVIRPAQQARVQAARPPHLQLASVQAATVMASALFAFCRLH